MYTMPFRISDEHTSADVGLVISGKSLEELFADAALGVTAIMTDPDRLEERRRIEVELSAENLENLFLGWLSEIVYYKDAECFLFRRCEFSLLDENPPRLKAELFGDRIDPDRHVLMADIKAVTYYKFKLIKGNQDWQAEVVLDL